MNRTPERAMNISRGMSPGFTLVELIVVIVLISIVLAMGVLSMSKHMRQRGVHDAAHQLALDMQKARLLAIERNASCSITINSPGLNQYTISITNEVVDLSEYRGGVAFSDTPNASAPLITFTPLGVCPNSGAIFLTGDSRRFRVRATMAGGISVNEFSGATWI